MNWTIILKNDPFEGFPGKSKSPAWLNLLGKDFAELGQWIMLAKEKLKEDNSPANFATFIRLIRDTDTEDARQNLIALPEGMGLSEINELEDLAEENLTKLKEEFKEQITSYQPAGAAGAAINRRQATIELFRQAAEYLRQERDVDWEELEGAISEINDNRTLAELLEYLGDDVNSIIASNLPEEGVDRLTALYSNYGFGTDYQKDFNVNKPITDELALVYITEIQEPITLTGNRANFAQRGFLANPDNPNVRRNNPPSLPFQVKLLRHHLQNRRGQRYEFTRLFKSMFKGDLSKQDNISSQLAQNLKNRAVNRQTVLEVVSEIAYKINQGDITIAEARSSSGLDFNVIADLIPDIKSGDRDEFIKDFQNALFEEGGKGQRDIVRQYEQKMSNYKKGVPKIFKDFIEHIIYNPNIYEEVFNSIWTNSYNQFRQDSDMGGFIMTGNIPGKSGKRIATWKIQNNTPNKDKIKKLHRYLILNDRTAIAEESDEAQMGYMNLRKLYRKYVRENSEDKEEELFGNLLNITDKDESELLRNFTDPFEKTVASLFSEVKDGVIDLNDLTGAYDIKLGADINIVNMLQELRKTADVLNVTDISSMLQNKYPPKITSDITNEELVGVVKDFVSDLNNAVKKIVANVKKQIEDKLELMIRNQGKYLQLNDAIFMILEGKGLITEVGE